VFGGEYLMQLNVNELKDFFAGFFKLDAKLWGGFLAGWKNLPNNEYHEGWFQRLLFGVKALSNLPPNMVVSMLAAILSYSFLDQKWEELLQSVTPFLGAPERYDDSLQFRRNKGDVAAKKEAMEMMCNCDRCEEEVAGAIK
jgi:hypothetical protein